MGLPGQHSVKNLPASARDTRDSGSIPGSGRSFGVGNGNLLQYSGKFHGKRRFLGYNPWDWKELDTSEHAPMHAKELLTMTQVGFIPGI